MSFAAFVLSTGRCGTQWLAQTFGEQYADCIKVEHEPLDDDYNPRGALGVDRDALVGAETLPPVVRQHIENIVSGLCRMPYLECGHPCWSSLPRIIDALGESVRIVHLVRHPVPTAMSWVTQRAYQAPVLSQLPEKILLSPFDAGVHFTCYRENWEELSPFEKCLFYWLEVQFFAVRMQSLASFPWLTLKYEDLFSLDGLSRLVGFLDLPPRQGVFHQVNRVVDRFRFVSASSPDHRLVRNHPEVMKMMATFGYDLDELDSVVLSRRYTMAGAGRATGSASPVSDSGR